MKKISYFTKVFLAISLLFNSLSPLSIVFADVLDETDTDPAYVEKVEGEETGQSLEDGDTSKEDQTLDDVDAGTVRLVGKCRITA